MLYVYVSSTNVTDNLLEIWNCQDYKNGDNSWYMIGIL